MAQIPVNLGKASYTIDVGPGCGAVPFPGLRTTMVRL